MNAYYKYNTMQYFQIHYNTLKIYQLKLIKMATANILGHSTNPARFVHFNPAGLFIDINQMSVNIDLNA